MAKVPPKHREPWSKKEVAKLEKMAARRPIGIIANELGRTEAAIRNKVREQGMSMKPAERKPYSRRP
jgi:hypothetical protein